MSNKQIHQINIRVFDHLAKDPIFSLLETCAYLIPNE